MRTLVGGTLMMVAGLILPASAAPADAAEAPGAVTLHACVGEGCAFGWWKALARLDARSAWDKPSPTAFSVAPGEGFDALDGVVVVEEPGIVEVLRPFRVSLYPAGSDGPARVVPLKPGDRLEIMRYVGEGFMVIRHGSHLYEDSAFWEWREKDERTDLWMSRRPVAWWWVRAWNAKGQKGWIRLKVCYPWDDEIGECPASLVSGFSVLDGSGAR